MQAGLSTSVTRYPAIEYYQSGRRAMARAYSAYCGLGPPTVERKRSVSPHRRLDGGQPGARGAAASGQARAAHDVHQLADVAEPGELFHELYHAVGRPAVQCRPRAGVK